MSLVMSTTWIVGHARPVKHARHLPPRITSAVAGNLPSGGYQFMVPDAAVVRPDDGAKLDPAAICFQGLDQLGTVRQQAMLQVDGR